MSSSLDRYVPEFDEDERRQRLLVHSQADLVEMLLLAYKEKLVLAKWIDELSERLDRVRAVLDEPSRLAATPGIPSADDLGKMFE